MGRRASLAIVIALLGTTACALPKAGRSAAAVAAFKREQPCPSTGRARGSCPGWVVDHITPLCAGGPDDSANMQWQTVEAAKAKDREERAACSRLKHR